MKGGRTNRVRLNKKTAYPSNSILHKQHPSSSGHQKNSSHDRNSIFSAEPEPVQYHEINGVESLLSHLNHRVRCHASECGGGN